MKKIIKALSLVLVLSVILSSSAFAFAPSDTPYDDSLFYSQGEYDIHYRIFEAEGEQKGRIMMVHGFICSTYAWEPMAKLLSEAGYECVLADLPGFGYSTRETADTDKIDRETLIEGLMKSIAPMDEWIVAGHSMGGGVALNIAVDCPEIEALLLYCPAPIPTFPASLEKIMTSRFVSGLVSLVFNIGTRMTPVVRLMLMSASADWEFSVNYDVNMVAEPLRLKGTGESLTQMMFNARPNDFEAASALTTPVLLVNAARDTTISSSMKEQISGALPNAVPYNCEKGAHMCIENCADELSEATLDFISE